MIRNISILFLVSWFCSCDSKTSNEPEDNNVRPNWLIGNWYRVNEKSDRNSYESWSSFDQYYVGIGCTLLNEDTVWKEGLRVYQTDSAWIYEVTGVNESPTLFTFTELTDSGFVCTNTANDFPKQIVYQYFGDQMKVVISAGDKSILFDFMKSKTK